MSSANNNPPIEDMTLKDLTPNLAALLCYAAGWISGILFLVLEQKNRFVRFHALQSIIVFGTITLATAFFGNVPVIGTAFVWIIAITSFIFWIILMVKALNGEYFKMPGAGDLAERLLNQSPGQQAAPAAPEATTERPSPEAAAAAATMTPAAAASSAAMNKGEMFRAKYYSGRERAGRVTASAFAIAWGIALLIFFNFYNQYIAWYEPVTSNGVTVWRVHTLITAEFNAWLPVVSTALVIGIIGNAISIAIDKYVMRQAAQIITDVFSAAAVISLLSLFPFDFSSLPNITAEHWTTVGVTIGLIVISIGIGIGALVKFIQLVVNVAEGKY